MLPFAGFLGLLLFGFSAWAIIDLSLTKKENIRALYKPIWLLLLVLSGPAGAFAWTFFGRPARAGVVPGGRRTPSATTEGADAEEATPSLLSTLSAPQGPEDSPEWAAFIADQTPTEPTDVLIAEQDAEISADFADWETEFDDRRSEDDD